MFKKRFGTIGMCLGLFLAFWLLAYPALAQSSYERGMWDGERDGAASVNYFLWALGGCLFGLLAVIIGYLVPLTSADDHYLMGKSPQYVEAYTDAFRSIVKRKQGGRALTGCLLGYTVMAIIYLIVYGSGGEYVWL